MRYGCSVRTTEHAELVVKYGYDYVEMNLRSLAALSECEYYAFQNKFNSSSVKIEVFNLLLPANNEIEIVGNKVDYEKQYRYLNAAIQRAYHLGAELMVFGSASARAVPDGFPITKAYQQIIDFIKTMMEIADRFQIELVIEPVCRKEVMNPIKTIPEAITLARAVAHPHVNVLCDLFHMYHENEPMSDIVEAGKWIRHAHISNIDDNRMYPTIDDTYDYSQFFLALKSIGYHNRLSLECFDSNIAEGLVNSRKLLELYR